MKIKCVEKMTDLNWFTVGGVYEVKGDTLVDDQGYNWDLCDDIYNINNVRFCGFFRFELVTDESSTPSKPTEEPVKEPVKPTKPWKESLIDQINQLPFEGGIISLTVCERERARIIELIEAM